MGEEKSTLRGFGTRFDLETGLARSYYMRPGDVKRWVDNDMPVDENHIADASKKVGE